MRIDLFKYFDPMFTVYAEIDEQVTTIQFNCTCKMLACPHLTERIRKREDHILFKQIKEIWDWSYWLRVPILFNPVVNYWVKITPDKENDFVIVSYDLNYWYNRNKLVSIIKDSAVTVKINPDNPEMETHKLLTVLMPGEGCTDITSSLLDSFNSFQYEMKPEYKCFSKIHNFEREQLLQTFLKSKTQRSQEMARLFFTKECTVCAMDKLKPMDDVVPDMSAVSSNPHTDHVHLSPKKAFAKRRITMPVEEQDF